LGSALVSPATGYSFVYHAEIGLIFATLVVLGPLATRRANTRTAVPHGLPDFPT
jgi:BCD family chlorophyll transporter-like MFS transporter